MQRTDRFSGTLVHAAATQTDFTGPVDEKRWRFQIDALNVIFS